METLFSAGRGKVEKVFRPFLEKGSLEATVSLPGAGRENQNIDPLLHI
jgi:hypothetical protein